MGLRDTDLLEAVADGVLGEQQVSVYQLHCVQCALINSSCDLVNAV